MLAILRNYNILASLLLFQSNYIYVTDCPTHTVRMLTCYDKNKTKLVVFVCRVKSEDIGLVKGAKMRTRIKIQLISEALALYT